MESANISTTRTLLKETTTVLSDKIFNAKHVSATLRSDIGVHVVQLQSLLTENKLLQEEPKDVDPLVATNNMVQFLEELSLDSEDVLLEFIDTLFKYGFHWPSGDHVRTTSTWDHILFKKITIPKSESVLSKNVFTYHWYSGALRSIITDLHVSPEGIPITVREFAKFLNRAGSPYAFALSPTTLHHNNLLNPSLASDFSAVPNHTLIVTSPSIYKPIVNDETVKMVSGSSRENIRPHCGLDIATRRLQNFIKFLGDLPWTLKKKGTDVGILLAGGLASSVCMDEDSWLNISKETDVDLFVYGDLESDRLAMTKLVLEHLVGLGGTLKRFGAVFQIDDLEKPVQIICSPARSPLGVLVNFDSSFIQIGYRGPGYWICTPAYNFFTPRRETLLTRYNVKLDRLLKCMRRGFVPVSDERGHIINPSRIFISPSWQLIIKDNSPKSQKTIDLKARIDYALMKEYTAKQLLDLLGPEYKKDPEKAILNLVIDDNELFEECVRQTKLAALEELENQPLLLKVKYVGSNETLANDKENNHRSRGANPVKRAIPWENVTIEEGLEDFSDRGNTLCNGFDIYTEWINSTLPIPAKPETEGIYPQCVLLRNVHFIDSPATDGKKLNVGTPQEPIMVNQNSFMDPHEKYPGNLRYYQHNKHSDPYRAVEGIFLFGDVKTEEQVIEEWKRDEELIERQEARSQAKRDRRQKAIADARARRQNLDLKKLPLLADESSSDHYSDEGLHDDVIENEIAEIPVPTNAVLVGEESDQEVGEKNEEPTYVCSYAVKKNDVCTRVVSQSTQHCCVHQSVVTVVAEKPQEPEKKEKTIPEYLKTRLQWTHKLKYEDLHTYVEEVRGIATIEAWELPLLVKAFAGGSDEYVSSVSNVVVKRSSKMVKVRGVIQFTPCMVFDVDDLFMHQREIDQYRDRSYNAVITLDNFSDWILAPHKHDLRSVTYSRMNLNKRKTILSILAETIETKLSKKTLDKEKNPSVTKVLKIIRQVTDEVHFEEAVAKQLCPMRHPSVGLPGSIPLFTCSRLYVSRHGLSNPNTSVLKEEKKVPVAVKQPVAPKKTEKKSTATVIRTRSSKK